MTKDEFKALEVGDIVSYKNELFKVFGFLQKRDFGYLKIIPVNDKHFFDAENYPRYHYYQKLKFIQKGEYSSTDESEKNRKKAYDLVTDLLELLEKDHIVLMNMFSEPDDRLFWFVLLRDYKDMLYRGKDGYERRYQNEKA